jgi:hypothetical protein
MCRHFARSVKNPALSEAELQEMVERILEAATEGNRRSGKVW